MWNKTYQDTKSRKSRQSKQVAKKSLLKMRKSDVTSQSSSASKCSKRARKTVLKNQFQNNKYIAYNTLREDSVSRKRWKTLNEREVLECFFELDQDWQRKTIVYIKDLVELSEKQIYKWGYEKRRRLNLWDKEEKSIDMKYITKEEDLTKKTHLQDLNNVVDQLFPDEENEEETLSDEQKEIYDYVRNQLVERSLQYEEQSDLDKLLNERIPIRNLAIEAKTNLSALNKNTSIAGQEEFNLLKTAAGSRSQKLNQNTLLGNFQNIGNKAVSVSIEYDSSKQFESERVTKQESGTDGQIGSGLNYELKDSNNLTHAKDRYCSLSFVDDHQDLWFESDIDTFLKTKSTPVNHYSFDYEGVPSLENIQVLHMPDPILNEDEEWKFESLNDMCYSLFDSDSPFPTNNN